MKHNVILATRGWNGEEVHHRECDSKVIAQILGCAMIDAYCSAAEDRLHHKIEFLETDSTWWDSHRLEIVEEPD